VVILRKDDCRYGVPRGVARPPRPGCWTPTNLAAVALAILEQRGCEDNGVWGQMATATVRTAAS
jgi:hypothetical protein